MSCGHCYNAGVWWILGTLALGLAVAWLGKRWLPDSDRSRPAPEHASDLPAGVAVDVEIGDELDLHGVPPREVPDLVDAFIEVGLERRRRILRIVHGRGIGALRATVRARLARHPRVRTFGDAPPPSGWGATVIELDLDRPDPAAEPPRPEGSGHAGIATEPRSA